MKADINAPIGSIPTTPLLAANVPANFAALLISAGGHISNVDTLTTYTGDTPQTGDSYARIGVAGAGLSAVPDGAGVTTLLARLTATRAGYLDNLSAGAVALASGVTVTTNNDKAGYALSATGANLVLVDGKALPAALQYIAASVAGKVSGAGSGTEVFLGLDGVTTRLTITVDASGNRTNVVYA